MILLQIFNQLETIDLLRFSSVYASIYIRKIIVLCNLMFVSSSKTVFVQYIFKTDSMSRKHKCYSIIF